MTSYSNLPSGTGRMDARPKRKRKVCVTNSIGRLVSGGVFWIPPALLKQAEEDGDE